VAAEREDAGRQRRSQRVRQGACDVEHAKVLRCGGRVRQDVDDQREIDGDVQAEADTADGQREVEHAPA
jgi:hypothetical protein